MAQKCVTYRDTGDTGKNIFTLEFVYIFFSY